MTSRQQAGYLLTLSHKVDEPSDHQEGMKVPGKLKLRVVFSSLPGEGFSLPVLFVLNDPVEDESHGGVEEDLGGDVEKSITTSGP